MNIELTDLMAAITKASTTVAHAITPDAIPTQDAAGVHVTSLTEALMGVTAALVKIGEQLESMDETHAEISRALEFLAACVDEVAPPVDPSYRDSPRSLRIID